MSKDKTYFVHIGRDTFLMLNALDKLTNRMCNSTIFTIKEDANKDISVFDYFGVPLTILNSKFPLDRRTKEFKKLYNSYGYFSAAFLPEIKKRLDSGNTQPPKPSWRKGHNDFPYFKENK